MSRVVHYTDVLAQAAGACGTALDDLSVAEAALYQQSASRRLRWAWRSAWWPVVCRCEERWFRPIWEQSRSYPPDAEVYRPLSGKYFWAKQASLGKIPEDWSDYWKDVTTSLDRTMDLDQPGLEAIGDVRDVWKSNPRTNPRAIAYRRDEWELTAGGLYVAGAANSVWLRYRVECPQLFGQAWDETRTYAVGNQVYWQDSSQNGDFWVCTAATAAGESPETNPAKWELVGLPSCFVSFLVQGMYADYLKRMGQNEKFKAEDGEAVSELTASAPDEWERIAVN
jgi:hypothetical protein